MNIADLLKQQLGGEVAKTLSGMTGASEGDLSKILGTAVPSLLSGLGSLASSKGGAGKIASAIGGMDSGLFGNLAGMLGSSAASKGGSMLGNLFSAGLVENISASISKFTGVNQGIVKMVVGYLTPMILGTIGKSLGGGKPDASSISRLFSEQKSNIAAALPSGFSLNSIQGFSSLASSGSGTSRASAPIPSASNDGGLGRFLVPAIIIACSGGLIYFWNSGRQAAKDLAEKAAASAKETADSAVAMAEKSNELAKDAIENASKAGADAARMTTDAAKSMKDAVGNLPELSLPNFDSIKDEFTSMLDGLAGKLGGVADAAGAEEILPDLKGFSSKLDRLTKTVTALPAEGKSMVIDLLKSQLDKINPILEKFTGISGIGEKILEVVEEIKAKLKSLIS